MNLRDDDPRCEDIWHDRWQEDADRRQARDDRRYGVNRQPDKEDTDDQR